MLVTSDKNTRLNFLYIQKLFIHFWTFQINIGQIEGMWFQVFLQMFHLVWGSLLLPLYIVHLCNFFLSGCFGCAYSKFSQIHFLLYVGIHTILQSQILHLVALWSPVRLTLRATRSLIFWSDIEYKTYGEPIAYWGHHKSTLLRSNVPDGH